MDKISVLQELIQGNTENSQVWYLLGVEYLEQNQLVEALDAFSKAAHDSTIHDSIFKTLFQFKGMIGQEENQTPIPMDDNSLNETDEEDIPTIEAEKEKSEENTSLLKVIPGNFNNNISDFYEKRLKSQQINFNDVGGLDQLKESIRLKIIKPFLNPGLFSKFKKKSGGGILLFGPPGCGKTFIARATAGECRSQFINVHISDILDPYIGGSERNMHDVFTSARAVKPAILFFDEVDAIGYNRSKSTSEYGRSLVDQFLSEIEGVDTDTDKLLVLGATNMPWDVDGALKRPGRFDKMIFVPPPDQYARERIFELKLLGKPVDKGINFQSLAEITELYSGADIENVVELATENVLTEIMNTGIERDITQRDLLKAIDESSPSTIEWLRTVKNYIKYANQTGWYNDVEKYLSKYKKLI